MLLLIKNVCRGISYPIKSAEVYVFAPTGALQVLYAFDPTLFKYTVCDSIGSEGKSTPIPPDPRTKISSNFDTFAALKLSKGDLIFLGLLGPLTRKGELIPPFCFCQFLVYSLHLQEQH